MCYLIAQWYITILSSSMYTYVGLVSTILTGDSGNLVFFPGDGIWKWKTCLYTYESRQKNLFYDNNDYPLASLLPSSMQLPSSMHYWKWIIEIGVSINRNSLNEKCEKYF